VTLVGYLVGAPAVSGSWSSPFRPSDEFDINAIKDVSHISYYGSGGSSVPEPSALLLMGMGLIAISAVRRRRCG